jgi:hypothetical protein
MGLLFNLTTGVNMKIVKFKNGTFGVQKGFFFKRYADILFFMIWWKANEIYEGCYQFKALGEASAYMDSLLAIEEW